jgi:hypothetical protein
MIILSLRVFGNAYLVWEIRRCGLEWDTVLPFLGIKKYKQNDND